MASDGSHGSGFDFEFEIRREPDRSKHSQLVFIKTFFGIADGPKDLVCEIPLALNKVNHLVIQGIEEKSIDREVAAERILSGMTELDGVGPSAIRVADVFSKSCDFDGGNVPSSEDGNDAERLADRQSAVSAEECTNFARGGICGHVEIFGLTPQKLVSDTPARPKRREACSSESLHHIQGKIAAGIGGHRGHGLIWKMIRQKSAIPQSRFRGLSENLGGMNTLQLMRFDLGSTIRREIP